MGIFTDNIKPIFQRKDILIQLILINVCVFLILAFLNITKLFDVNVTDWIVDKIAVPARLDILITHFWTPLTYMFVHEGFLHILFNMLMLYWFGRIFLSYFNPKSFGSLYILGGLAGAGLFILAFNTIPMFIRMNNAPMIGASASVMAIIFAAAFYRPNAEIQLLILGRIKIIYIAIIIFILDFIGLSSTSNPEGHVAHIGGALVGYIYAKQYLKGKDIVKWLNKLIDSFVNIFKPSKKMRVRSRKPETDYEYNTRKKNDGDEIDRILDKIKASGYNSLNSEEKKRLFDASKK
ncbi:MAG: rhomboid family intramembrane serine protease [Dysgonomonas sp.]|nr:rhomboid family intramembrane serine protease [Dysgonomonas sp.]